MPDFTRNNMDSASTEYLREHAGQPIWWQHWNEETLDYAKQNSRLIFVSIGYSDCTWCRTMSDEAFMDQETADFLNENFVSIKVDREERPDIDKFMMNFIADTEDHGGMPLNIFLTPNAEPFYAMKYAPKRSTDVMPGFLDILRELKRFYDGMRRSISEINQYTATQANYSAADENINLVSLLSSNFDRTFAGFGEDSKFPPHSTILFMMYYFEETKDPALKVMVEKTLEMMLTRGLHDHLQGGFFRFCLDRAWTVPNFEKMLYDQAMAIWELSIAYGLFGKEQYRRAVEHTIEFMQESLETGHIFYSSLDAGTDEGAAYLWTFQELTALLDESELNSFQRHYDIQPEGNFKGKIHLVKKTSSGDPEIAAIEAKLRAARKNKPSPFIDRKIITSWNALAGIGLVHAYRNLHNQRYLQMAEELSRALLDKHFIDGKIYHGSFNEIKQREEYLEDIASTLLLLTYLHEESGGYEKLMTHFAERLSSFRDSDGWFETRADEWQEIYADAFDQPIPSSVSLAEMAIVRARVLLDLSYENDEFKEPLLHDFYNLSVLVKNGLFHLVESPIKIEWDRLPINTMQKKGERLMTCHKGICT